MSDAAPKSTRLVRPSIVQVAVPQVIDEVQAETIHDDLIQTIREEAGGSSADVLADLSALEEITADARHVLAATARLPQIRRIAFVGGSVFIRTVATFILRASGVPNRARFFATRQEAQAWLVGQEP